MKLKTLVSKALKAHPEAGAISPQGGVAILFIDEDNEVHVLKAGMNEDLFQQLCTHIVAAGPAETEQAYIV